MDLKQYGFKSISWVCWKEVLSASGGRVFGGFPLPADGRNAGFGLRLRAVVGPGFHQLHALIEQIAAPVGGFHFVQFG